MVSLIVLRLTAGLEDLKRRIFSSIKNSMILKGLVMVPLRSRN